MLINSKDIRIYNCSCIKFKMSTSKYTFSGMFTPGNSLKTSKGQIQEENRTIDAVFIFKGTKDIMQKNISRFIEDIKDSTIQSCSLLYDVILEGCSDFEVITNNSVKLPLKLTLLNVYEKEKVMSTTINKNIELESPKPCYANLELNSTTNVISYTVNINDTEIIVKNIKGNETVYIGSGKVIAGGKSKINDVDLWEFPILNPGLNTIKVNRADVNLKIKYCERW